MRERERERIMEATHSFQAKLHRASELYFAHLGAQERGAFADSFKALDTNGDGRISQGELTRAIELSPAPAVAALARSVETFFRLLDKDGNGSLDFQECKALLFLTESALPCCDRCGGSILDNLSFRCQDCFLLGHSAFDLCLTCFPHRASTHLPHHRFLPLNSLYSQAVSTHLWQAQCVICGDFHIKNITSLLFGGSTTHMICENNQYVCEWCFAWSCNNCGKFSKDVSNASPRQWLRNTSHCKPCGKTGKGTNYDAVILEMKSSNVLQECSTCRIKAKNGTLWESGQYSTSSDESTSGLSLSDAANLSVKMVSLASSIANIVSLAPCTIM